MLHNLEEKLDMLFGQCDDDKQCNKLQFIIIFKLFGQCDGEKKTCNKSISITD